VTDSLATTRKGCLHSRIRSWPTHPLLRIGFAASDFWARWRHATPGPARSYWVMAVVILAIGVIIGLTLDEWLTRIVQSLPVAVRELFKPFSAIGNSAYVFLGSALLAGLCVHHVHLDLPQRVITGLLALASRATFVFLVAAASGLLAQLGKHLIGRALPRFLETLGAFHFEPLKLQAAFASFPSGHTITAFSVALSIAWFAPRLRWPLFALACLVGLARLMLGAHFPSDVVAGAVIGLMSSIVMRQRFSARRIAFVQRHQRITPRGDRAIRSALAYLLRKHRKPSK